MRINTIWDTLRRHSFFCLFFICILVIDFWILFHRSTKKTEFITCSSFDRGPLGTYALYNDLDKGGVPVHRLQLAWYSNLKKHDRGKTLLVLMPRVTPSAWEWNHLMNWVAQGNRLITSGFLGPRYSLLSNKSITVHNTISDSVFSVIAPIDSQYPYPEKLPTSHLLGSTIKLGIQVKQDTVQVRYFTKFTPDMLPLISSNEHAIAVKKAIGKGEWVLFAPATPFSNDLLRDERWYDFATRLLLANQRYVKGPFIFDEYHNGYRATKSLWELLCYYKFDSGILLLSALLLTYLFFSGIRIVAPVPSLNMPDKDVIPGLRSTSSMLCRMNAWNGLLKRELDLLRKELKVNVISKNDDVIFEHLAKRCSLISLDELKDLANVIDNDIPIEPKQAVKAFNMFVQIRKELRL